MVNDCDPNNPPFGGYNLLPQYDIPKFFPYKELDTIKMLKNGTDTVLFNGTNTAIGYTNSFDQDPNCPHLHKDQWMKHAFTDKNNNSIILDAYIDDIEKYLISLNQNTYGPVYAIDITNYPSTINIYAGGVEYKSVYADNEFTDVSRMLHKVVYIDEVIIRHYWMELGVDALYIRNEDNRLYVRDQSVYAHRKANNFGLKHANAS